MEPEAVEFVCEPVDHNLRSAEDQDFLVGAITLHNSPNLLQERGLRRVFVGAHSDVIGDLRSGGHGPDDLAVRNRKLLEEVVEERVRARRGKARDGDS